MSFFPKTTDSQGWKGQMPQEQPCSYWYFVIQGEHKAKKLTWPSQLVNLASPQPFSLIQLRQRLGCFDYSGYWANSWCITFEDSSLDARWLYVLRVGVEKLKSCTCMWMLPTKFQIQRVSLFTGHLTLPPPQRRHLALHHFSLSYQSASLWMEQFLCQSSHLYWMPGKRKRKKGSIMKPQSFLQPNLRSVIPLLLLFTVH